MRNNDTLGWLKSMDKRVYQLSFFLLKQGLSLLSRLEYSGVITVHCSLNLLGSNKPLISASLGARTTDTYHHTWLTF